MHISLKTIALAVAMAYQANTFAAVLPANTLPDIANAQVVLGSATFTQSGNTLVIDTTGSADNGNSVINYGGAGFNIGSASSVQVLLKSPDSIALQYDKSGAMSHLEGSIGSAQGHVVIVNPNGISQTGSTTGAVTLLAQKAGDANELFGLDVGNRVTIELANNTPAAIESNLSKVGVSGNNALEVVMDGSGDLSIHTNENKVSITGQNATDENQSIKQSKFIDSDVSVLSAADMYTFSLTETEHSGEISLSGSRIDISDSNIGNTSIAAKQANITTTTVSGGLDVQLSGEDFGTSTFSKLYVANSLFTGGDVNIESTAEGTAGIWISSSTFKGLDSVSIYGKTTAADEQPYTSLMLEHSVFDDSGNVSIRTESNTDLAFLYDLTYKNASGSLSLSTGNRPGDINKSGFTVYVGSYDLGNYDINANIGGVGASSGSMEFNSASVKARNIGVIGNFRVIDSSLTATSGLSLVEGAGTSGVTENAITNSTLKAGSGSIYASSISLESGDLYAAGQGQYRIYTDEHVDFKDCAGCTKADRWEAVHGDASSPYSLKIISKAPLNTSGSSIQTAEYAPPVRSKPVADYAPGAAEAERTSSQVAVRPLCPDSTDKVCRPSRLAF